MSEFTSNGCFEDIGAALWTEMGGEKDEEWTKTLPASEDEMTRRLFDEWVIALDVSGEQLLYLGKTRRKIGSEERI